MPQVESTEPEIYDADEPETAELYAQKDLG